MDNYVLTGPQGSQINVGTYVRGDQPQDYGSAGLMVSSEAENTFVDGGVLSYEHSGIRHWNFSLLLATGAAGAMDDLPRILRQIARPGGYLEIQRDGVASANVLRWDVIAGRVEEAYDLAINRAARLPARLFLDTQPYGYLPTWITLASSASVGNPGFLTIPGGSIIGDVPGFAELVVQSASQTLYFAGEPTYVQDAVLWSGANRSGGMAFFPAGSLISAGITGATLTADAFSPASQALRNVLTNAQSGWTGIGYVSIPSGLEASMRGRWRAFAFAKMSGASMPYAGLIAGDVVAGANAAAALASAGNVATLAGPAYLAADGAVAAVPTGQVMLDLGEISIPPTGSGIDQDVRIRLWASASWPAGPATVGIDIGGVWLMDLDGPAGILPRGLAVPTTQIPSVGNFYMRSYERRVAVNLATGGLSSGIPAADVLGLYRGQMPMAHPSQARVDIYVGAHRYTKAYHTEVLADAPIAWYRLTETAGATMIDSSGSGNHGVYQGTPSLTASSLVLPDDQVGAAAFAANQFGIASTLAGFPAPAAARTLEAWWQGATSAKAFVMGYGLPSTNRDVVMTVTASQLGLEAAAVGGAFLNYAFQVGQTYHLALAFGGTYVAGYVNGQGIGTTTLAGGAPSTTGQWMVVGAYASGAGFWGNGSIDEAAVYNTALSSGRILQHWLAGKSAYGATSPPYHTPQVLAASYRYRPRFGFSRGL